VTLIAIRIQYRIDALHFRMKKYFAALPLFMLTLFLCRCGGTNDAPVAVSADSINPGIIKYPLTKKQDSLLLLLEIAGQDTHRVNIANGLIWQLNRNDPDSGIRLGRRNLVLAEKLNFKSGVGRCMHNIAYAWMAKSDYDSAMNYVQGSIVIFDELKIPTMQLAAYNTLGSIYLETTKYDKALEAYLKVLRISEASNNSRGLISALNNCGLLYSETKKFDLALSNLKRAIKVAEDAKDERGATSSLINLGKVYGDMGVYDSVIYYNELALKSKREANDKSGIATCLDNIGQAYLLLGKSSLAIEKINEARQLQEEIGDKRGAIISIINLGDIYSATGKKQDAIAAYQLAYDNSLKLGTTDLASKSADHLATIYSEQGDFKTAFKFHKIYASLKDSVMNEASNKNMAEQQARYETEIKDKTIALLNTDKALQETEIREKKAESEKRESQRNVFIVGFVLVLALAGFILVGYRQKRKTNFALAQKNELIEEKNKNITDSINYAQRIQKAMLTSDVYLQKQLTDYFILNKPKDIVSGDFYWATKTDDGKLFFFTADCTGHGVPGAFMSLIGVSLLNEIVIEKKTRATNEILNLLREEIIRSLNPDDTGADFEKGVMDGMDGVLCMYDEQKMKLEFSCANNPLWIFRDGTLSIFPAEKMPIGKHQGEKRSFTKNSFDLQKGDIIYTFSDGYADQFGGPQGKKFKYKQLQELIIANAHRPLPQQKENLDIKFEEWRAGLEQVDDVLVVGIKI
jgi:serine phosphatase RsbU (regulator of sigma subunit)